MTEGGSRISSRNAMGDAASAATPPLITVVTVVRNGAGTIRQAIDSVAGQTFRDFEYVIVDGASTDGTVQVLQEYGDRIGYWISERDSGIYSAWNKALGLARGTWVAFLGADDSYYADALDNYARKIATLSGNIQYISSRVDLIRHGKAVRTIGSAWSWPAFLRRMTVAHVGSLHHRTLFDEYGRYDESYKLCGDYELLLRPREKLRTAFVDQVTARMTLGGASNANVSSALAEQERAKRNTGNRAAWLCALERRKAYAIHQYRSLVGEM